MRMKMRRCLLMEYLMVDGSVEVVSWPSLYITSFTFRYLNVSFNSTTSMMKGDG